MKLVARSLAGTIGRVGLSLFLATAAVVGWGAASPDEVLRLRVLTALNMADAWTVGTEVRVDDARVRLQGFVRTRADIDAIVSSVSQVEGVRSVREQFYLSPWPEAETAAPVSAEPPGTRVSMLGVGTGE